jgi:hypothetical protein
MALPSVLEIESNMSKKLSAMGTGLRTGAHDLSALQNEGTFWLDAAFHETIEPGKEPP